MIRSIEELGPEARVTAHRLLDAAVATVPRGLRPGLREELTAHLLERLDAGATAAEVEELLAGLPAGDGGAGRRWLSGLRPDGLLTRIAQTWWRPGDPRLFLPRAVGLGWDLNAGAVAVRLGLIEPDAEAVPFSSTPDAAFRLAAGVPIALAGAVGLHYLVRGRTLPDRLAAHWDVAGRPDRWVSKRRAAVTDSALAAGAAALAGWAAGSDRSGPARAGALAGATLLATLGAGVTVARPTRGGAWLTPAMLAA
ncbi:MAG: DUF1648 domain-containing protein, partial [Micropruina sp.]|uniref:DUF1648 domain-containing protein n=1 Tax=Micropruina sp. TaxID=2737536 RepID=UPI0039E62DCF